MGNCLEIAKLDLPDIRIRIRSNCCSTELSTHSDDDEPDGTIDNKQLEVIPEENI